MGTLSARVRPVEILTFGGENIFLVRKLCVFMKYLKQICLGTTQLGGSQNIRGALSPTVLVFMSPARLFVVHSQCRSSPTLPP